MAYQYLTYSDVTDEINQFVNEGAPLTQSEVIANLIRSDRDSVRQKLARKAQNYFVSRTDVLDRDFRIFYKKVGEKDVATRTRTSTNNSIPEYFQGMLYGYFACAWLVHTKFFEGDE